MPTDQDVITREPLNVETSWQGLAAPLTPTSEFYTRNNFPIPQIRAQDWRLALRGFEREATLTFDELRALPQRTVDVVLECAGNSRTFFEPRPEGTPWRERAVACARFRGPSLGSALARAGVPAHAVELVFRGADGGTAATAGSEDQDAAGQRSRVVTFERSLPVDVALASDTILAWEMNDAPLLPKHGAPVRLLVPGWYGVASVKWLADIRASREPFVGHFQTERYVYARSREDRAPVPVREKRVNSIIASPTPDEAPRAGAALEARGWAWSSASIARVEVSVDGGATWKDATLGEDRGPHAWRGWSLSFTPRAGELTLLSRAHDAAGHVQPARPEWNVHGYGYNAPRPRRVFVR